MGTKRHKYGNNSVQAIVTEKKKRVSTGRLV